MGIPPAKTLARQGSERGAEGGEAGCPRGRCDEGGQELLGHKDVSTTMIYTYVLNRGPLGVRSPFSRR